MKITVAITGASGAIYAKQLLFKLSDAPEIETINVVFSSVGKKIYLDELNLTQIDLPKKCNVYSNNNFEVSIASGSNPADAMVICPCSCTTMAKIAAGIGDNLITRAASVMLKERRKLVIVLRETPLSLIVIKNMETLTLAGATILPACPSFYSKPSSVAEVVDTVVFRILSHLNINHQGFKWGE